MTVPESASIEADFPHDRYWKRIADAFDADAELLGTIQVICAAAGSWTDRVAPLAARLLEYVFEEDGERVFRGITIIAPPGMDASVASATLVEAVAAHLERIGQHRPSPKWLASFERAIDVEACTGLHGDALIALAAATTERRILVAPSAAEYIRASAPSPFASGDVRMMSEDEAWCRRLADLCDALEPIAEDRDLLLVLDTGRDRPVSPGYEILSSSESRGVLGVWRSSPERALAERLPAWKQMIAEDRIGAALREVAELDNVDDVGRAVIRIQLLHAAGLPNQALLETAALPADVALGASLGAKLAMIAAEAGGGGTAVALLRRHLDGFAGREDLQNAIHAADRAGEEAIVGQLVARLGAIHPDAPVLSMLRYKAAVGCGDHLAAATELDGQPGREPTARTHRLLANAFAGTDTPSYELVISVADREGDGRLARTEVARHALAAGRPVAALNALATPEGDRHAAGTLLLADAVEQLALGVVDDDRPDDRMDSVQRGFMSLVRRMSVDTRSKTLRARLLDILEPSTSGTLGYALALAALAEARACPVNVAAVHEARRETSFRKLMDNNEFKAALGRWFDEDHAIRVGYSRVERALVPGDPDEVAEGIVSQLGFEAPRIEREGLEGLKMILAYGTAVARHAKRPDMDMEMIRVASSGLTINGAAQDARDLIETMAEIADTPRRRRLAWFGLADIYARCGRNGDAAMYAAAGLLAHDEVDEQQLWHETLVVQRIHRDMGLFDEALAGIAAAEALLTRLGRIADYRHRLGTMRVQTRLRRSSLVNLKDFELETLLADATVNARQVLAADDEPGIIALLLAQLLREARVRHVDTPADARATLDALAGRTDGAVASQIEALGRDQPTGEDLSALGRDAGGQRYSDDLGTDGLAAVLAARRALSFDATLASAPTTALALEFTADRAIAHPGWLDAKTPPASIDDPEKLMALAREVSLEGTAVMLAGLDADGALVRMTVEDGVVGAPVREPVIAFSKTELDRWRREDLYDYGLVRLDEEILDRTTAGLRWSSLPSGRFLIVADTRLRSLPPTLFMKPGRVDPAGLSLATAAAPSLSWLAAARRMTSLGDGRRVAWVPGDPEKGGTLAFVAGISEETLVRHRFALDRTERVPAGMAGASIAVVVAHGGLSAHGGAFQTVSDEGVLTISAGELARSLHNVGVVLLFVCSGGRSDTHPAAAATLGLPRELLDQGVQAVVGSPWPLDSQVPARWLPGFLKRWDAGERLAEAVHSANLELHAARGDLAQSLALNVLGNPDLRDA